MLGVLLRSFVEIDFYLNILLGIISVGLVLFFSLVGKNRIGILISIFVVALSLGVLRFHQVDALYPQIFEDKLGEEVSLSGVLVDDPDIRESNQKLTVLVKDGDAETKVLLTLGLGQRFSYGDQVNFVGELEKPENFTTDQGKLFDYINYLRKDGIDYVGFYPDVEVVGEGFGNPVKEKLFKIKNFLVSKINSQIPQPESILLGGLILGERGSFSQELRTALVSTGTIHIVALSGYNVTIVAEWIMKILYFLPGVWSFAAGILGIILFVLMAGAGSTAVRAGIMASLALVARATGRTYAVARALILAGVFMVLINPLVLRYDVSFQLSFLATVAVIFFAPRLERYFTWVPKQWKLRDLVSVTFAVYIFVLPFIMYKMGNLSLVALPANILILPFIPATMMFGFLTSLFGSIWHVLSVPFGFVSTMLLRYEIGVVEFFAKFYFASLSVPNFPLAATILIYAYFSYMLFSSDLKKFFTELA